MKKTYPGVKVFAEDRPDKPEGVDVWRPGPQSEKIDLVVTLGGDGTILHAASLFSLGAVPPVLSFSMGTLGFLLPFRESPAQRSEHTRVELISFRKIDIDDFAKGLEAVFHGKTTLLNRMRLSCTFYDKDDKKMDDDGACSHSSASNERLLHPSFRMAGHERDCAAPWL